MLGATFGQGILVEDLALARLPAIGERSGPDMPFFVEDLTMG